MARPGFFFCLSPDTRLARDQVDSLLARHPPASGATAQAGWECFSYWGDDPLDAFWDQLTLGGLIQAYKALILHNAQALPADAWRRLSAALNQYREQVWPFFCLSLECERGGAPKLPAHLAKLPCFQYAQGQGWVWSSPGLVGGARQRFVLAEAKRLGIAIAPATLQALLRRLPDDASAIGMELGKLALTAAPDGVVPDAALELVDYAPEVDIFSFMRTLQSGRTTALLWRQVQLSQQSADGFVFRFLAALEREARQLWQILAGEPVRCPPSVLAAKEKLARALGREGVAALLRLALEADKGVKSGERNPEQALERLIASLGLLFSQC